MGKILSLCLHKSLLPFPLLSTLSELKQNNKHKISIWSLLHPPSASDLRKNTRMALQVNALYCKRGPAACTFLQSEYSYQIQVLRLERDAPHKADGWRRPNYILNPFMNLLFPRLDFEEWRLQVWWKWSGRRLSWRKFRATTCFVQRKSSHRISPQPWNTESSSWSM